MDSRDFEFLHENIRFTLCLCPDSAKTFSWDVKATRLGKGPREGQGWERLAELLDGSQSWAGRETSLLCKASVSSPRLRELKHRHRCANQPPDVLFFREGEFHCHC